MEKNSLVINGRSYEFSPGETILSVCRRNSIDVPTLCYLKPAPPTGRCGVCVVQTGAGELVHSCRTQALQGLTVLTESPAVVARRKEVIKGLLSRGNHNCAVRGADDTDWAGFQMHVQESDGSGQLCPVWGDCRLQELAYRYQVRGDNTARPEAEFPVTPLNPFIARDYSRCIQCGRCASACNAVQVNNAIDWIPDDQPAAPDRDFPLPNEACVFCGECIQACPVGALVERECRYQVRPWEIDKKVRTTCSYCGVGCQLNLHVRDNRVVKVTGVSEVGPNWGSLCVKGRFGFDFIGHPDRLTTPLIREDGKLRQASWDEALDFVAKKLADIREKHGADSTGLLTSARVSNEENYIAQKFARAVMKTNNVDHCARL